MLPNFSTKYKAPFRPQSSHSIDMQTAQKLLDIALSKGGDYADLFFEYHASGSFSYDEGMLKSAGKAVTMGLGVRVLKGDATGYAFVEDFTIDAMEQAAKTAAQIANSSKNIAPVKLTPIDTNNHYPIETLSLDINGTRKKEFLERADQAARKKSPKVSRVDASISEEIREVLIATSTGKFCFDSQPLMRFGIRTLLEDGNNRQSGSSGGGGRIDMNYFDQVSPEAHAEEAVRQGLIMLDAREAPAGEMEVVLAPGDSGILLHEAVGHGLEADFNRKKTSNYTDQIGKKVASELCTVVDDATLLNGRGSINVDDEGNVPTSITLIENGILKGYMQDQHSAKFFGVNPSGNGRRESFQCYPMPRMTNTLLTAGEDDPEDIIKSVKQGIYAKKFGGGQVDISNGDFVFSLTEGYLIENGKITAPLKGVNLIGNGPEAMTKVVALGHDFEVSDGIWTCGKDGQSVPVGVGCPTVKISAMTVGGTQI